MFGRQTAPVCIFVYKRLDNLRRTITSLKENTVSGSTDLYIFSDAAATEKDVVPVQQVRSFVRQIEGFRSVTVHLSAENKGLASSIIHGVTQVIEKAGKVIVLEDDLIVSPNFLDFMNGALDYYEEKPLIFSISGYSSPIKNVSDKDVYFTRRASSWGWATWKNRWDKIDWEVCDFNDFMKDKKQQRQFNRMGSDLTGMLRSYMNGEINSWAIRWTYHQFKYSLYTVFPVKSKVINDGFSAQSTNTFKEQRTRFATLLDDSGKTAFTFPAIPALDKKTLNQFIHPYRIRTRIYYKLMRFLN
ncbi:MAG: glycosyltransferase [Chitinophagaceae bacterium]|nr:glycosyltransferase [Chitinophagaceae bacterium]